MMMQSQQPDIFELLSGSKIRKRRDRRQLLARKLREVIYGKRPAVRVYSQTLQKQLWIINEALTDPGRYDGQAVTLEALAKALFEDKNRRSGDSELLNCDS
jgi:hypothetical protein